MKRLYIVFLLPLLLAAGCSRGVKTPPQEPLYQQYAERQNISVAQINSFLLNDTVKVDVVLLQADDEEAWRRLTEEFDIRGEEGTVSWLGEPDAPAHRTPWDGSPVMRIIASCERHTIGFYLINDEAQYDALIDYQLENTKNRI